MKFMEKLLVGEKVEWKTLGEVANCFSGGTPKTSNSSFYDGEIPWIRSGEINFNVIKKSERNITKEGLEKSSAKMIRKNSVVLAMTGATVGKSAVIEFDTSSNQSVAAIETNNEIINYKYLYYFLAREYSNLKKLGQGTLTSLNLSIIKNIKVPIPSIETQEKIVKILDSYTKYITELQEKLKIELQARNKQYNYYRDMLLSEDYLNKISKKLDSLNYVLRLTTLGEIGKFTRGNGLQKKDFREKGKPVIHYGQIYTQYGFSTDKTISFAEENIFSKLRKAKPNDILIATTSENIEDVAKSTVWLGNEEVGFSGDMYSYSTNENSKYIAYYFQTAGFQKQKERKVTGTKLIRIHGEDMEKFTISLPPIEIQNKIVKILDRFQELLSDTKGLLPLEIEQRRKQYEYYREKLLTFDKEEGYALSTAQHSTAQHSTAQRQITSKFFELLKEAAKVVSIDINDKVEWKTLSEVAKYSKDRISFEYLNEKNYVGVENLLKNRLGKIDSNNVPTEGNSVKFNMGDILIGNIRPYLRKIWLADIEGGTNGDVLVISIDKKHKNKILSRYLYQILSDEKFFDYNIKYSKGAKMPRGDKEKIMEYKIPLPPLPVQEYIVSILNKFDALVNDLSQGLPREIELRQKQYEYYREKLLDFEK